MDPKQHILQTRASWEDGHGKKFNQSSCLYRVQSNYQKNHWEHQYSRNSATEVFVRDCSNVVQVQLETWSPLLALEVRDFDVTADYSFAAYWSVISFIFTISYNPSDMFEEVEALMIHHHLERNARQKQQNYPYLPMAWFTFSIKFRLQSSV